VWSGGNWVNSSKQFITYNSNNVRLNKSSQTWNTSTNNWSNSSIETYTFNAHNFINDVQTNTWNQASSTYTNYSYQHYYLSCSDPDGLAENRAGRLTLQVYPNPSETLLHIKLPDNASRLRVFNLSGSLVLEQGSSESVDVSGLCPGIYQLTVFRKDGMPVGSARFVRQN
jgi:hypothetical protein